MDRICEIKLTQDLIASWVDDVKIKGCNCKEVEFLADAYAKLESEKIDILKSKRDAMSKILELAKDMIKNDCEHQSLKDGFNKLKTEIYNINSIGEECTISSNEDNTFSISAKVEIDSSKSDKQLATLTGKIVDWKIKF